MKDIIEVYDKDSDSYKKMQVVTIFKLDNYSFNYIIYRTPDKSHYYIAKYKESYDDLYTDFSEQELKLCEEIFKQVLENNE